MVEARKVWEKLVNHSPTTQRPPGVLKHLVLAAESRNETTRKAAEAMWRMYETPSSYNPKTFRVINHSSKQAVWPGSQGSRYNCVGRPQQSSRSILGRCHSRRGSISMRVDKRASSRPLAPAVIAPSQNWDGYNGPWSSFTIQIGTPAHYVRVFISTSGSQIWAVAPQACNFTDSQCRESRGGTFDSTKSTKWKKNEINSKSTFALDLEEILGYSGIL